VVYLLVGFLRCYCPQPSILFPRLLFVESELIHVLEWESGIGKPIPLLDDLSVGEGAIFQEHVGEGPSVFVFVSNVGVGLVKLQTHPLTLDHFH